MNQGRDGSSTDKAPPALLASVHDVSPLTLAASRRAVALATETGVPVQALTLLVIPCHEDRAPLDACPEACAWLRDLDARGAHLIMHGYSHRMEGRCYTPSGIVWAHGFARGQGEFFRSDAADAQRRLDKGKEILVRAGLASATTHFVPPAWLLSREARRMVLAQGFHAHEEMSGIVTVQGPRARRLVGWGSLNALEACATRCWATLQLRRVPADTRVAIHPADMTRPRTIASIRTVLHTLLARSSPKNYRDFLRSMSP